MIAGQRKAHKFIWLCLAIVIPILLFFAVKNLRFTTKINETDSREATLPVVVRANNDFLDVSMVKKGQGYGIALELKKPLRSTSSLVYGLKNGKKSILLGQITGAGPYMFYAKDAVDGIVIVDAIKEVETLKLLF